MKESKGSLEAEKNEEAGKENNTIEKITIGNNTIVNKPIETDKKLKVHLGTVRVVREELNAELNGRTVAEIHISDIVPRTGYTRKTVDTACKWLEQNGEFSFERIYPRGMRVTNFGKK